MSASSQTLVLSELVARILYFLRDDPNSLAACIRLNKLWSGECARFLWAVCSTAPEVEEHRRSPPQLLVPVTRQLSELAQSGRLQWYARYIRHLSFLHNDITDHSTFANISFPSLQTLKLVQFRIFFRKDNHKAVVTRGFDVLQYLQPRLRYCQIEVSSVCSQFFATLLDRCPHLEELGIAIRKGPFDSFKIETAIEPVVGLPEYLQAASCLKDISLYIWHMNTEIWTSEVFLALAQNKYIQSLRVPNMKEDWLSSLQDFSPGTLFRKTYRISASIGEAGLDMLAPHIHNVVDLDLCVLGPSLRLMGTVATIPSLSSLRLRFDGCNGTGLVRNEDLMLLAENCSGLCLLHIRGNDLITAVDLTDEIVNGMARCLPKLMDIELHLLGSSLTENALLSFGLNCRRLKSCKMSACVSYEDLLNSGPVNLFPVLETLQTFQREVITSPNDPNGTALRLRQAAPLLRCFHYYDDDSTFRDFDEFQDNIHEAYMPEVIEIRPSSA
ncbi:hypothetical protein MMC18_006774 [Xylographa bjoerkii]|nr:hypothetical protein [Xylographa bjoerkii]